MKKLWKWLFGTRKQQCNIHDVVLRSEHLPTDDDVVIAIKQQLNENGYITN
jgi:hypothetical protein